MISDDAPAPLLRKEKRAFYWTCGWASLGFFFTVAAYTMPWWVVYLVTGTITPKLGGVPFEGSERLSAQFHFWIQLIGVLRLAALFGFTVSLALWLLALRSRRRAGFVTPAAPHEP